MTARTYAAKTGTAVPDAVNALIAAEMQGGNMLLMYTDRFLCVPQQEVSDLAHLLEVRVFSAEKELKIMRPSMDCDFSYRLIDDAAVPSELYIDEDQYLDIAKSSGTDYTATGGGTYTLPVADAKKVRIRNYLCYNSEGIAQITDFRIVAFLGGESDHV